MTTAPPPPPPPGTTSTSTHGIASNSDALRSDAIRAAAREQHVPLGVPLGALFLLVTACATVIAYTLPLVAAIRADEAKWLDVFVSGLLGLVICAPLGAVAGLLQRRPLAGLLLGLPIGALLGLIFAPVCLVPDTYMSELFRISLFGSIAIVVMAIVLRRL